ncbi:unnamed protein product [Dovyalis caffra]|uniref:DnaJ homolog subfamily C member 16 n=1 Tax=Dovyalis caffra TaxID=77055 RepID=A0AAV1S3Q7_9ROSI|nr:unnamed protein product [Dovyalis caffra]
MASTIKAYGVPLFLFSLSVFYQLVVLPRCFPPSHYDVLEVKRHSSVEEVREAYEKFSSKWNSGAEIPSTTDFIKDSLIVAVVGGRREFCGLCLDDVVKGFTAQVVGKAWMVKVETRKKMVGIFEGEELGQDPLKTSLAVLVIFLYAVVRTIFKCEEEWKYGEKIKEIVIASFEKQFTEVFELFLEPSFSLEFQYTASDLILIINKMESVLIQYAYELLMNPLRKRDYDLFGIDEQAHIIDKINLQYAGETFSGIDLPLLDATTFDLGDHTFNEITSQDFATMFDGPKPWLVLVYSLGSNQCAQFFTLWKEIAALLDGVANVGIVELGELQLAMSLAERKPTGQFFYRNEQKAKEDAHCGMEGAVLRLLIASNLQIIGFLVVENLNLEFFPSPCYRHYNLCVNGLPSLVAFPSGCKTSDCLFRFEGDLSIDAVTDWFATTVLSLPRILYYSKESLASSLFFVASASLPSLKVGFCMVWPLVKVKVIFFTRTGERATPFVRQTAKSYWAYTSFAFVLWREEDFSVWWNTFEVESAPAIVFVKDPG